MLPHAAENGGLPQRSLSDHHAVLDLAIVSRMCVCVVKNRGLRKLQLLEKLFAFQNTIFLKKTKQKQYSCYAIKTRAMVQNNLQCSMVTLFLCLM